MASVVGPTGFLTVGFLLLLYSVNTVELLSLFYLLLMY